MSRLRKLFEIAMRKRGRQLPMYSLRQLAMKMKLSHAFLSQIFSEKKKIPLDRIDKLAEILELDELDEKKFAEIIIEQQLKELANSSKILNKHLRHIHLPNKKDSAKNLSFATDNYEQLPSSKLNILNPWYNIAILDLIALKTFRLDYKWMASQLQIQPEQAYASWQFLADNNYIVKIDGQWVKANKKIRLPTRDSQKTVRSYHSAILQRAIATLNRKITDRDFSARLIAGASVAARSENVQATKELLHESLYQATETLTDDDADSIYQVCVLMFPIGP